MEIELTQWRVSFSVKCSPDEDVSKVGAAVSAFNLRPHPIGVRQPLDSAGNFLIEAWPPAVRLKLVF